MIVSKLEWQYNYWIDLSDRWADVFSITMEEFQMIQSWQATMVDDEVVDVPTPEVVEPTAEELQEIKNNTLIEIKIPLTILETVKDKLSQLILLFSDLKRVPDGEYLVLSNILFKYVPQFLTKEEYTQLKTAWVIFDELVTDLFSTKK